MYLSRANARGLSSSTGLDDPSIAQYQAPVLIVCRSQSRASNPFGCGKVMASFMVRVKLITEILPEHHECRRSAKRNDQTVLQGDPRVLHFLPVRRFIIFNSTKLVSGDRVNLDFERRHMIL